MSSSLYQLGESFDPNKINVFPFYPGDHISRLICVPLHEFIETYDIPLHHISRWADFVNDNVNLAPFLRCVFNWTTYKNEYQVYYFHHGIVVESQEIIHLTRHHGLVQTSLQEFAHDEQVYKIDYYPTIDLLNTSTTIHTAQYFLNQSTTVNYNGFAKNCEHFAIYCKTGEWYSSQIEELQSKLATYGSRQLLEIFALIIELFFYIYSFPEGAGFIVALCIIFITMFSVFYYVDSLRNY